MRGRHVEGVELGEVLDQVGLDRSRVEDMYKILAIANYEDRFVIPTTHREYAENAFDLKSSCGFSFGNGCSGGTNELGLFGKPKHDHGVKQPVDVP
jgi:nitrate reductase / nitrite oxidoreductase, beta subunit